MDPAAVIAHVLPHLFFLRQQAPSPPTSRAAGACGSAAGRQAAGLAVAVDALRRAAATLAPLPGAQLHVLVALGPNVLVPKEAYLFVFHGGSVPAGSATLLVRDLARRAAADPPDLGATVACVHGGPDLCTRKDRCECACLCAVDATMPGRQRGWRRAAS